MYNSLKRYLNFSFCCVIVFAVFSCATANEYADTPPNKPSESAKTVPEWLTALPEANSKICAVGRSGKTYYSENAVKNASEDARGHLAISLSAHIESILLIVESENDSSVQKAQAVNATTFSSDFVLENSEIANTWVDELGIAPGAEKDLTYVLVCVNKLQAATNFKTNNTK